jgi:hypothetical protein
MSFATFQKRLLAATPQRHTTMSMMRGVIQFAGGMAMLGEEEFEVEMGMGEDDYAVSMDSHHEQTVKLLDEDFPNGMS